MKRLLLIPVISACIAFTSCAEKEAGNSPAVPADVTVAAEKDNGLKKITAEDMIVERDEFTLRVSPIGSYYYHLRDEFKKCGVKIAADVYQQTSLDKNGEFAMGGVGGIKNGDTITFTVTYDKDKLAQAGYELTNDTYSMTFDKMDELISFSEMDETALKYFDSFVLSEVKKYGDYSSYNKIANRYYGGIDEAGVQKLRDNAEYINISSPYKQCSELFYVLESESGGDGETIFWIKNPIKSSDNSYRYTEFYCNVSNPNHAAALRTC